MVGSVDVAQVPDDLDDDAVFLVGRNGRMLHVQLGTGEVRTLDHDLDLDARAGEVVRVLRRVLAVEDLQGSGARLIDLDTGQTTTAAGAWPGEMVAGRDGALWWSSDDAGAVTSMRAAPGTLELSEPSDVPAGHLQVVGTDGDAAIVTIQPAAVTYQIELGGSVRLLADEPALTGGEGWFVTATCDEQLDCGLRFVDLWAGEEVDFDGLPDAFPTRWGPIHLSADGRRGVFIGFDDGPEVMGLDADTATVEVTPGIDTSTNRPFGAAVDPSAAHLADLGPNEVVLTAVATGEQVSILTDDLNHLFPFRQPEHVLFAPPGWAPPAEAVDGPTAEASGG